MTESKIQLCRQHYQQLPPHVKDRPTAKHLIVAIEISERLLRENNKLETENREYRMIADGNQDIKKPGDIIADPETNHGSSSPSSLDLFWSSDYPKSAGLYWVRYRGQKRDIVSLTGDPGNVEQMFYGERVELRNLPKDWEWQWAGPIPEPQELKNPDQT